MSEVTVTSDSGLARLANRALLKGAVQNQMFCKQTNVCLDVRTAVEVTLKRDGTVLACEVWDGSHFDKRKAELTAACAAKGVTLEVLDGRELFGRRKLRHER